MARRLRYRALEALTRRANRFLAPKVAEVPGDDLYARIYLEKIGARLEAHFPGRDGLAILDAGCGAGRLALPLARAGHRLTGIDYHEPSLAAAGKAAEEAGLALDLVRGELLAAVRGLATDGFDAALCTEVLYTCSDHREILLELRRVLRPGGLLMASFATPFYLITTLLRQQKWDQALFVAEHHEGVVQLARVPAYYNWKTRGEVEELLGGMGFEPLAIDPIGTFSGHGSDGMAALVDLGAIDDPAALESLHRLETGGLDDYRAVGRYLLATARLPAGPP